MSIIRCGSPYTLRICPGQLALIASMPLPGPSMSLPWSSSSTGCTPNIGWVAHPGFIRWLLTSGLIMMPPVSVCHQVSTMGQRCSPTALKYHSQASGLIGSPTLPSRRRLLREVFCSGPLPSRIKARRAVGAV
ncbi:hypothetical protein D3C78_1239760 [compost metagenome]